MSKDETLGAAFPDGAFTRREALSAGFTDIDLTRSSLRHPFHGVWVHGDPESLVDLTRAYATKIVPGHAFTGWSAAVIRGWPIPRRFRAARIVEIAGRWSLGRVRTRGVASTRVRDDVWATTTFDSIPLVSAPLTLLKLAQVCTLHELVTIGDAAVATSGNYQGLQELGSTTIEDLVRATSSFAGCHGSARLRESVLRVRDGVESRMESLARLAIIDAGLPEPEVGVEIWDGSTLVAVGDLVFRGHRVIVEYEGKHHFEDPVQAKKGPASCAKAQRTRMACNPHYEQ